MIFPSDEPVDAQALRGLPRHVRKAILVGAVVAAILLLPIPLTVTSMSGGLCAVLPTPDSEYDSLAAVEARAGEDEVCLESEVRRTEWLTLIQMVTRR